MIPEFLALALYTAPLAAIENLTAPLVTEVRYRRRARPRASAVDLTGCCWPPLEAPRTKSVRIITDGEGRWIVREQVRPGIEGFYDIFPAFKEDTK